jgi:hypothetical protein
MKIPITPVAVAFICGLLLASAAAAGDVVVSVPAHSGGPDFSAAETVVSDADGFTRTVMPDISWSMLDAGPDDDGRVRVVLYDAPKEVVEALAADPGFTRPPWP